MDCEECDPCCSAVVEQEPESSFPVPGDAEDGGSE